MGRSKSDRKYSLATIAFSPEEGLSEWPSPAGEDANIGASDRHLAGTPDQASPPFSGSDYLSRKGPEKQRRKDNGSCLQFAGRAGLERVLYTEGPLEEYEDWGQFLSAVERETSNES